MDNQNSLIIFKLLLSVVLTAIIGLEREYRHKGAGLRTHILVGVSATLIVLTSIYVSDIYKSHTNVDPTRLLHGIISGIGFLCAGTIIRGGSQVKGLTTAASVWTAACIGMAVGCGQFFTACIFTLIVFVVLLGIHPLEKVVARFHK